MYNSKFMRTNGPSRRDEQLKMPTIADYDGQDGKISIKAYLHYICERLVEHQYKYQKLEHLQSNPCKELFWRREMRVSRNNS